MSHPPSPAAGAARQPAADRLRADVQGYLDEAEAVTGREVVPRRAAAVVVPYDPHTLAGPTAGAAFASVEIPDLCVVVTAPPTSASAHAAATRGAATRGAAKDVRAAVGPAHATPLGDVRGDAELAGAIARQSAGAVAEAGPAARDEMLETLLPFIQVRNAGARVVVLRLAADDWESTRRVAAALASAVAARPDVLVVAASNMSRDAAGDRRQDRDALALEQVVALDGRAFVETVRREAILMTGAPAVACACEFARLRGARAGELVAYSHSGIVTGHADRVTGYAAVLLGAE